MDSKTNRNDMHDRPGYFDPSPYPEIKVSAPNEYYAKLLLNDYAGNISEFTAINQYLYHNFVLRPKYNELASIIENISITEMKHMEILARLIHLLGGNPIYTDSNNVFWNAKYVFYGKDVCNKLYGNLDSENQAIQNYQIRITQIQDKYIQAILNRIILDEKLHVKIFEQQIQKYC